MNPWIHLIYIQETSNDITVTKHGTKETHGKMNDLNDLECDRIFGNDINFHTPRKQNESSQYKTPERNFQEIS